MKRFIKELRRREVFRTAGLYVGICWILIEVGSVILPVFGVPDWVFRGAIVAAVVGFPFMLVLAWFFDVNEEGISLQGDPTESRVTQLGARKSDFAIIGVLVLALLVSVSLNLRNESPVVSALVPVPVSVNRFENTTGDPAFSQALEQALITGLEVAPHVAAFRQDGAVASGRSSSPGDANPSSAAPRRVAPPEGMTLILSGSVQASGDEFVISVDAVDTTDGQSVFDFSQKAASRDAVLAAAGKLSAKIRKELGHKSRGDNDIAYADTFVAASLDAASAYASATQFEQAGNLEEAARLYAQAGTADADLGRAFAALALVESALGQADAAAAHWTQARALTETMTEREWLRFLGRYEASVALDGDAAMSVYSGLVEKYPADVDAHQRYAIVAFDQLNFAIAAAQIREILSIFPANPRYQTRLALYEMYAGDWQAAADEAGQVISADPEHGAAYLAIAMAGLALGDVDAARDAYERMAAESGTAHDASVAALGLADIDLYFGDIMAAQERLRAGIEADAERERHGMAALKHIALAQSFVEQDDIAAAITATEAALSLADGNATTVSAALIYLQAGEPTAARAIADTLMARAAPHSRAFGKMLNGMLLGREGSSTQAILAMRDALATADLWLIRYEIGKAYLRAGNLPEALGELTTLEQRAGEATSIFLDDMPTYRFMAELPYWKGRVQEAMNTPAVARASYQRYLALRPQGGAMAQDAKERAARLE